MMKDNSPLDLEIQLAHIQRLETKIRQKTYSPIMYGDEIVALVKFVRDDAEQIGRDHSIYMELSAVGNENALPFFLVRNDTNYAYFTVTPGNAAAREHIFCTVEMNQTELKQLFDHCHTYRF